ncbi:hypothetical protein PENTCL1PPCAC_9228, partial [Pristionchus entomophagus]
MKLLIMLALFAVSLTYAEDVKIEKNDQAVGTVTRSNEIPSASDDKAIIAKNDENKSTIVTGEPDVTKMTVKKAEDKKTNKASRMSSKAESNKKGGYKKTQAKHNKKAMHGKHHKRTQSKSKANKQAHT